MEATFEVTFLRRQWAALLKIEDFLGVKFSNRREELDGGLTIATNSEGFADEIERIKNKITLDVVA